MAEKTTTTTSGGIGIFGLLGVAFVVLKLCGVIHWSWWWVLVPFWGPVVVFGGIALLALVIWLGAKFLVAALSSPEERARAKTAAAMRKYSDALRRH